MLKDKNFWRIHLKWGIILGCMLIAMEVLKMFARKVDYQASQLLDIAMIIGFILVLFYGVREFKDYYPQRLSFAKAFLSTVVMSLIGTVVIFGYDNLHYSLFEKDGLQQKYNVALEKYKQNLAKDTITAEEMRLFCDSANSIIDSQKEILLSQLAPDDSIAPEIESGILIFRQYYTNKIISKPENDKENYKLGEFLPYARRVLMETLVSYTEQNQTKPSTSSIQTIIQNSNKAIENVNPLDIRFLNTKNKVPRYDKNGQYALVSAFIYLLYGMFFGIFVAMFHYRSKNPIEPIPEDELVEEEQENIDEQ